MRRCTTPALVFVALLGLASLDRARDRAMQREACIDADVDRTPTPAPLLTLRTRGHEVAVYPGEALGFTVLDEHGRVLAERIDEDDFAQRFPALHEQLDSAFARGESQLDATALPRRGGTVVAAP